MCMQLSHACITHNTPLNTEHCCMCIQLTRLYHPQYEFYDYTLLHMHTAKQGRITHNTNFMNPYD
jgi:hypothetical protein